MPADLAIRMNGTDLVQALMNLAINAFQASTEPLVVSVSANYHAQPLSANLMMDTPRSRFLSREAFLNQPPMVAIHVQDTGPGISERHLDKIFDSYFTTKPTGEGTGLGLAIVRRLVGNAQGAIRVETEPGLGTTFSLYLPVEHV
jgi:signal transduction histidine kinase